MRLHTQIEACSSARLAIKVGQWLLPLISVLVVLATLARAAEQVFVDSWVNRSDASAITTQRDDPHKLLTFGGPVEIRATASHWVVISSTNNDGTRFHVTCFAPLDRIAADVLEVRPEEFVGVAAGLCKQTGAPFDAPRRREVLEVHHATFRTWLTRLRRWWSRSRGKRSGVAHVGRRGCVERKAKRHVAVARNVDPPVCAITQPNQHATSGSVARRGLRARGCARTSSTLP